MRPRDVIVTPTWNWHDHGKKGAEEVGGDDGPVIWLDGLDLPNFVHFPVHFVEHYASARYPAEDAESSPIVFPWAAMQEKLDAPGQGVWTKASYLKKDGSEISRIIGASAERLDPEAQSPLVQETASCVYHVIQGSGYTAINEVNLKWKAGDTFCVPAWHKYQHFADGSKVYLYRFDDKPMLTALGFYRQATDDIESLVSD
ncbi:hypothetical protein SEUCBS139899_008913 [Sporothrix eucalyptigena]|uniref:Gentisate 1,2-dioxygenase n=1 Tax=Sporothrix eucalyptigena TaxID=1812306 RepID=A0ABP0D3U0_9PEZI